VREIAKKNEKRAAKPAETAVGKPARETLKTETPLQSSGLPAVPNHIKAASLADILGFNPNRSRSTTEEEGEALDVPEKFRRFYKLLIELRNHVLDSLGQHSEETLKRSAKEDAGDLSGYGQHMADAGTDTFDRDFALSLVSSEQDALSEVEAAIKRVRDGTYGICELTGKPISKDRLLVVPFTRYSAEAQKELEKTRHRSVQRAGIFADTTTEEGGKIAEEEPEE
jgi:RNA polymerase-binding transcription factor DksA